MPRIKWNVIFESRLFFIVGIGVLLLISGNLMRAQLKDRSIRQELAALEAQVKELEEERVVHEALLSILETPEFLESEARRSLGYVLPGEQLVVIEKKDLEKRKTQEIKEMSNPRKWWLYFFGKL